MRMRISGSRSITDCHPLSTIEIREASGRSIADYQAETPPPLETLKVELNQKQPDAKKHDMHVSGDAGGHEDQAEREKHQKEERQKTKIGAFSTVTGIGARKQGRTGPQGQAPPNVKVSPQKGKFRAYG